jgi:hypothetical protein
MASMFPTASFLPPITLPTVPSPPPARVVPYVPTFPLLLSPLTPPIPPVNKKIKRMFKKRYMLKEIIYKYVFSIFKPI